MYNRVAVSLDGKVTTNRTDTPTVTWLYEESEDNYLPMPNNEAPKYAGKYGVMVSFSANENYPAASETQFFSIAKQTRYEDIRYKEQYEAGFVVGMNVPTPTANRGFMPDETARGSAGTFTYQFFKNNGGEYVPVDLNQVTASVGTYRLVYGRTEGLDYVSYENTITFEVIEALVITLANNAISVDANTTNWYKLTISDSSDSAVYRITSGVVGSCEVYKYNANLLEYSKMSDLGDSAYYLQSSAYAYYIKVSAEDTAISFANMVTYKYSINEYYEAGAHVLRTGLGEQDEYVLIIAHAEEDTIASFTVSEGMTMQFYNLAKGAVEEDKLTSVEVDGWNMQGGESEYYLLYIPALVNNPTITIAVY